MDGTDIGLRLVGAFYVFAGYAATRATLMSLFLDRAIAAIGATKPKRAELARSYWLLGAAFVVMAGGATLIALLDVAAWLFLASAVGQAAYLFIIAPRMLDADDPPDEVGRRQSTNAFIIYLAATAYVVWALSAGKLESVRTAHPLALAAVAVVMLLHVGYVIRGVTGFGSSARSGFSPADDDWDASPGIDPATSRSIKVMSDYGTHALWALDDDIYGDINPKVLDLSPELTRDLIAWAEAFSNSLDLDDPSESRWTETERSAHAAMARPLAIRLAHEKPDRTIFVVGPDGDLVEIKADEELPPSAAATTS